MLGFVKKLFNQNDFEKLKAENEKLKFELKEKQDVINKTNAFWKKQLYIEKNKKKKTPL